MSYQFDNTGKLKEMTAEELIEADRGEPIIVLNKGVLDDEMPYWAYVEIKPSHYEAFMVASEAGHTVVLGDYGKIVRCGFEEEVPGSVKEEMKRLHGCDDDYMEKLTEKIRKAQKGFLQEQQDKRISDALAMLRGKKE